MNSAARARALDAYERDLGPGLPVLPWRTPGEATAVLPREMRARLGAFRRDVRDAWLTDEPARALARALEQLDPQSVLAVYPGSPPGGPRWFYQTIGGAGLSSDPVKNHEQLPSVRLYRLRGSDPFANRPVANVPLVRAGARASVDPLAFVDALLIPNRIPRQLRMVLFDRRRCTLYAGFYRPLRGGDFTALDHALMLAARPALRTWDRTARAIGGPPLGETELITVLSRTLVPAVLLRRGRIVFANAAGRLFIGATLDWLAAGRPANFADVTRLSPCGYELELILPARGKKLTSLPPSLRRVADLLVTGVSDKEIACRLETPLSTVRTYVSRIYTRLEVENRRELMRVVVR
mgnify:CR=1 FL=1